MTLENVAEAATTGDPELDAAIEEEAATKQEAPATEGEGEGTEAPAEPELTEVERLASRVGWAPKNKWKGPPEAWRPADEFIIRGQELLRENRDAVKKLEKDFDTRLKRMDKTFAKAIEREKEKIEREYRDRARLAVASADPTMLDAADRARNEALKDLNETMEAEAPQQAQEEPNEVAEFRLRNREWFQTDAVATAAAVALCGQLQEQFPSLPLERVLQEVETQIRQTFGKGAQKAAEAAQKPGKPVVEGGLRPIRTASKTGWDSLPPEAKQFAEREFKGGDWGELDTDSKLAKARAEFAKFYYEAR